MPGMGQALPPPAELLRYKNMLLVLASAYAAILVAGISVGGTENAFFYVLILISMLLMALRSDQCMSQCVMPFAIFTMLIVLNDVLVTLSLFARTYPAASQIFSTDCPHKVGISLPNDTVVYLQGKVADVCATSYTIPKDTKVDVEENVCNQRYVIRHVLQFLATAVDLVAAVVSWRMLKTALGAAQFADAGQQMLPPGGIAGPGGMGPGGGPGGMGPPGAGPAAGQRGGDFRAFQGSGQTLSG